MTFTSEAVAAPTSPLCGPSSKLLCWKQVNSVSASCVWVCAPLATSPSDWLSKWGIDVLGSCSPPTGPAWLFISSFFFLTESSGWLIWRLTVRSVQPTAADAEGVWERCGSVRTRGVCLCACVCFLTSPYSDTNWQRLIVFFWTWWPFVYWWMPLRRSISHIPRTPFNPIGGDAVGMPTVQRILYTYMHREPHYHSWGRESTTVSWIFHDPLQCLGL